MSGNRANASAIQRRTNNPQPVRNTQTSSSSRYSPPPPPQQANPKLSVSDAIALITIRLGRVETFINQLPPLDQLESISSSQTEETSNNNMSLVNDNVFQSIITRLEKLEMDRTTSLLEKKSLESIISSLEQKINLLQSEHKLIPTTQTNTTQTDTSQIDTTQIDDKINSLDEKILQLKDIVLALQTYTMNTNTKLIDLIITNTELNENHDDSENISKHLEQMFKHNFENLDSEINNDNSSDLFEEELTENTINQLTLNQSDLSNLSINI
jgi:hypothetical protein